MRKHAPMTTRLVRRHRAIYSADDSYGHLDRDGDRHLPVAPGYFGRATLTLGLQCHVRLPPALAGFISTLKVKVRCSSGRMAPTPTSLRAISSPRSLRMVSTMEYSHAPPSAGLRKLPSTRSGVDADTAVALVGSLKRSLWRQAGHTPALSRMVSRQCGQVRVAPAVPGGVVLTKLCRCAHEFCARRCRPWFRPSRTRPGRACANPPRR